MTYQLRSGFLGVKDTAVSASPAVVRSAHKPPQFYRTYIKRVMDIILVLIASLPVITVIGMLALMIYAAERRSPFYLQDRIGRNGRVFRMWKLRTMVPDADRIFEAYLAANPEARAEWDRTQKLRHDPRVTRLGDMMRRTSLDELPQLWNVLKGDMSLVGPRPMMVSQKELYPGAEYYLMRPGVTGFWQTSVRNLSSFSERAMYDRQYYQALSFRTDIAVILKTVKVVANGTGC